MPMRRVVFRRGPAQSFDGRPSSVVDDLTDGLQALHVAATIPKEDVKRQVEVEKLPQTGVFGPFVSTGLPVVEAKLDDDSMAVATDFSMALPVVVATSSNQQEEEEAEEGGGQDKKFPCSFCGKRFKKNKICRPTNEHTPERSLIYVVRVARALLDRTI
eukprot:GABV01001448.1.p2 GENE.GABV01001448.1~~GABV01001448.1.p2  ORF type:complete len:159 (-),score=37.33 GABV01001448.1:249-725(-)